MMDKYLDYLNKNLVDRQKQIADALANGAAKSYEEYKQLVGEIRGLSFAQLSLNDLVRKMEENDE
jgi:hypothetical protein